MSNIKVPYDGTILRSVDLSTDITKIKRMLIANGDYNFVFNYTTVSPVPIILTGKYDEESEIEPLVYPINFTHNDKDFLVVDLRGYISSSAARKGNIDLLAISSNKEHMSFEQIRFVATAVYMNNLDLLNGSSKVMIQAMAVWLSNILRNAYSTNVYEELKITTLVQMYFTRTITNQSNLDDSELDEVCIFRTKQNMTGYEKTVDEVVSTFGVPRDLDSLIGYIQDIGPKFKNVSYNSLASLMSKTVFIPNSAYNIISALEHPPTMFAILWSARNLRVNSRSILLNGIKNIRDMEAIDVLANKMKQENLIQ